MSAMTRSIGALALFAVVFGGAGCDDEAADATLHYEVKRGRFVSTITGRGTLAPQKEVNVLAKQSGTITSMARDGKLVTKGEVVLQQDSGETDRELMEETNTLNVMEAELMSKLADLNNRKNQALAQVDEAERRLELAKIEHQNMVGGAYIDPATRIAAKESAAEAKATAAARSEDLSVIEKLRQRGVVTAEELRDLNRDVAVLEAGVRETAAAFDRVLEGAEPGEVVEAQLEINVQEYRYKVSRQWLDDLEKQEGEITQRSRERIRRQKKRIARLKQKLAMLTLRAPTGGVLLVKSFWGRKIGPGRRIWRGVPAVSIADTSKMLVTIKVGGREQALLKRGQSAVIRVDAAGRPIKGRVQRVGRFGRDAFYHLDARTKELVGDANRRVYDVSIVLEESADNLVPGLMAEATITTHEQDDVVTVPRELVRDRTEEADGDDVRRTGIVRLVTDTGVVDREVELGEENRSTIVVTRGLEAGDRLLLGD